MKIVYLSPIGTIGGAEMCLLDLLGSIRRARPGWDLVVILAEDGPLRGAVERLGVRAEVEPMPAGIASLGDSGGGGLALLARMALAAGPAIGHARRLRRRLLDERPDLIQTNGMKAHLLGTWAAPPGVRVVWHLHDYLGARPAMVRLLKRVARRPDLSIVAVSRSVEDDARLALGPQVSIQTVYNAVDLHRFGPGPGDGSALDRLARLPAAPAGTIRVGLVATFARWKGHDVFFEAISRIPRDRPARFYVVGGPIYRSAGSQWSFEELWLAAARRGVIDRLAFVGAIDDPAEALRSLDVAVHASTRPEPFGRSIVEAMATGLGLVAIRAGGAAELFDDGETALGCPPNHPEALALAIDRLILDPGLRRRLGAAGRDAARRRFDADWLFEGWTPIYGERAGGDRAPESSRLAPGRAADTEVPNTHAP